MPDSDSNDADDEKDDEELSPRERMKKMMGGDRDQERGGMGGMMGGMGGMDPMSQMMGMGMGGGPGGGDERLAKELQEIRVEAVKIRETLERIADSMED